MKLLVCDEIAEKAVEMLKAETGIEVTVKTGMDEEQLCNAVKGKTALIVRSATKVTAKVIGCADSLKYIGC